MNVVSETTFSFFSLYSGYLNVEIIFPFYWNETGFDKITSFDSTYYLRKGDSIAWSRRSHGRERRGAKNVNEK